MCNLSSARGPTVAAADSGSKRLATGFWLPGIGSSVACAPFRSLYYRPMNDDELLHGMDLFDH